MEQSMVGCRHYEVARYLKLIPLDKIFTLTLIEPVSSTASSLSPEELWHLAVQTNPHQFATSISRSDLNEFKFNSDFLFNVWTIVNDVVHGRMPTNV
ncbi:PDZ domain-containing protein gipc1 [Blomia tropicalis]|nr:PDZ domain-containing protein gipc1 [Blomia tropicalis]